MKIASKLIAILIIILFLKNAHAQHSKPDTLEALRINTKIDFDGNPDEPVWQTAQHVNNFTQRELHFGEPASEKTETAVLYDNYNLYNGIWCYMQNPAKTVTKFKSSNLDYERNDVFGV